jgi:hypothetical protein
MGTEEAQQISYPAKIRNESRTFIFIFIIFPLSFFSLDSQRAWIFISLFSNRFLEKTRRPDVMTTYLYIS